MTSVETSLRGGTVQLTDGPSLTIRDSFRIEPEYEYIRSDRAVIPDPSWSGVDTHGHAHRWEKTGDTDRAGRPTYTVVDAGRITRHVDCDGSCDGVCEGQGFDVPAWACDLCGDWVEPGYQRDDVLSGPGVPYVTMPGGWDLTVDARPMIPPGTTMVEVPAYPPRFTAATLTPPDGDTISGQAVFDWYGTEQTSGEPLQGTVRFYEEI